MKKKTFKILVISDTHSLHKRCEKLFPKGDFDMIIHAGDVSNTGTKPEVTEFLNWFSGLNQFEHKLFIAGNHDFLFETLPDVAKELIPNNIIYLQDEGIKINGIKFWGSPQTPYFHNWAFNRQRGEDIKKYWDIIPYDTDIVITHGTAKFLLDYVINNQQYVGCEDLAYRLEEIEPLAHIGGHIHCAYGKTYKHNTMFYNASMLNEQYFPINPPHIIEINFDDNDKPYIEINSES
jgi:Icc-related predicted phosphoesterase